MVFHPYPDAHYCSKVCGSLCCKVSDVFVLKGEDVSYEYWSSNHPAVGRTSCGCLDEEGLCRIHEDSRPLVCRLYPYFRYQNAIMASLGCPYVREVVLPRLGSHHARDAFFKKVMDYISWEGSDSEFRQIEDRLRECKGIFLFIRGNAD
ncbi:MAG TPA: hypothetical protein GX507_09750 [Clostridia bacterium]|nr:hypothetical protein [Clostridia bacterium]